MPISAMERAERIAHWHKENPARVAAHKKKYADNNREQCRAAQREWASKNREKINARQRRYYELNKTKVAERAKIARQPKRSELAKRHREWVNKNPWAALLRNARGRALKKNLECTLDSVWARENWTGKCALTGIAFVVNRGYGAGPFSPSIDRIDPARGYVPENCRFILARVNSFKGADASDDLMLMIAKALVDHHAN